jgi:hypothetical protein
MIEVADVQDSQTPIAFPEIRQLNDGFGLQPIPGGNPKWQYAVLRGESCLRTCVIP